MARRRRRKTKQPISQVNIATSVIGLVCLLAFFVTIEMAAMSGGELPRGVSALAVISLIASAVSVFVGRRTLSDMEHRTFYRISGFALPLIGFLLWLIIYIYGIFVL